MRHEIMSDRLVSQPLQQLETGTGVLLKRGCTELHVEGAGALDVVQSLLMATSGAGASREDLLDIFSAPMRPAVDALVQQLLDRRLLVPHGEAAREEAAPGESRLEVFYWEFDRKREEVEGQLAGCRIMLMGVNSVSLRMATSLVRSGFPAPAVIDFPLLRNMELFDASGRLKPDSWPARDMEPLDYEAWQEEFEPTGRDCLVATSDFGGMQLLREWNRFCIDSGIHFLPVVLQNLVGYVGPLVIPGETPCFECLLARQNSNRPNAAMARTVEEAAFEGQGLASLHPAAAAMLAEMATLELLKLHGGRLPSWRVGTLLELQVMVPALQTRKLLKVPRCPACSPLNARAPQALDRLRIRGPEEAA